MPDRCGEVWEQQVVEKDGHGRPFLMQAQALSLEHNSL